MGIALGAMIASFIPFSPPLILEIVFLSIAASTFVTSILVKQGLRAYCKFRYGASNSDGYECARSPEDQREFITQQASKFGVSPDDFENLANHCKDKIHTYKSQSSFWNEFSGNRTYVTNSFKDIYHGLMNPKLTNEEAIKVKELIQDSHLEEKDDTPDNKAKIDLCFQFGSFFNTGVEYRTLGHQFKIAEGGGLDDEKIRPFCA